MGLDPSSRKGFTAKAIARQQVLASADSKETCWSVSTPARAETERIRASRAGKVITFGEIGSGEAQQRRGFQKQSDSL